ETLRLHLAEDLAPYLTVPPLRGDLFQGERPRGRRRAVGGRRNGRVLSLVERCGDLLIPERELGVRAGRTRSDGRLGLRLPLPPRARGHRQQAHERQALDQVFATHIVPLCTAHARRSAYETSEFAPLFLTRAALTRRVYVSRVTVRDASQVASLDRVAAYNRSVSDLESLVGERLV